MSSHFVTDEESCLILEMGTDFNFTFFFFSSISSISWQCYFAMFHMSCRQVPNSINRESEREMEGKKCMLASNLLAMYINVSTNFVTKNRHSLSFSSFNFHLLVHFINDETTNFECFKQIFIFLLSHFGSLIASAHVSRRKKKFLFVLFFTSCFFSRFVSIFQNSRL